MGMFEQPGRDDAPLLASEQFGFDPLGAHRRRGQDDEAGAGARAPLVDHPRGDFLADARRARDQHPAAGRCDPLQGRADGVDRHRAAVELVVVPDLLAKHLILAAQPLGLGRAVDEVDQPLGLERLFDEVDRALADRGDRGVEIAVARDHQHRQRRIAALDLLEQLNPVEPRALQPHVEQDHRRAPLLDRFERRIAVGRGADRIAFVLEHAADELADVGFIVDDQNFKRHQSSSSLAASSSVGAHPRCSPPKLDSRAMSKAIRTWVPPPARSRKAISPICSSTIFLTIARPSPVPRTRVVI